jgi:hypothetical protein
VIRYVEPEKQQKISNGTKGRQGLLKKTEKLGTGYNSAKEKKENAGWPSKPVHLLKGCKDV